MASPPPELTESIDSLWRLERPQPTHFFSTPAFVALRELCQRLYPSAGSRDVFGFALSNALSALGVPCGLRECDAHLALPVEQAAIQLDAAFRKTELKRIHLCPLDCADDLPPLSFGPNCIRRFKPSELEAIVDSKRLRRTNASWLFDTERFSQFTWLVVEETFAIDREPAARAVPTLFANLNRDFAAIEPHKGHFPSAVEAALAAVLLAPWEDWVEYEDVDWRPFRVPWAYTVVDDIFQRAAPPPSPESLSWEPWFVHGQHGEEVEIERPTQLPISDRVSKAPEWLSEHAWTELLRARDSVLFGNPIVHFLVHAFLNDDIDEFLAHITVIEAALGSRIDYDPKKRPKLQKGKTFGATDRVASRLSASLGNGFAGDGYKRLFDIRSQFVHGRSMVPIPGQDRNMARRLARQAAVAITKAAIAEPGPESREAYLSDLLTAGYAMSG
jgi:hypothetical protein